MGLGVVGVSNKDLGQVQDGEVFLFQIGPPDYIGLGSFACSQLMVRRHFFEFLFYFS